MNTEEFIYRFRFDRETQEELAEIVEYYNTHPNPDNGKRFLVKVETVVELLQFWPEVGIELEEIAGVRAFSIPKYPYRLYYTVFRDELEIIGISIYHTKRELNSLIEKLEQRKSRAEKRLATL